MMPWTVQQLLRATQGQLYRGPSTGMIRGISIDSRRLQPGDVYVAIRGRRFDGHQFVEEAAHRGAAGLIVSQLITPTNGSGSLPTIVVDDTTEALGDLARFHRQRMGVPVIAVTGSCGKTTTKDLAAGLVDDPDKVLKTHGSQNNHIGVPLTLLRLQPEHQVAVVELGSNHPGEIAYLASIVQPNVALITNVGPAHLEFFGSLMEVLQEKLSLLEALPSGGTAILPGDQLEVCLEAPHHLLPNIRVVTFGTTDRCDIQAIDIQRSVHGMSLRLRDCLSLWKIPLIGYHNVENALAAIACAWASGVPLSMARKRLKTVVPLPLRSEIVRCGGLTILNDCYNANPLSFARALETLRDLDVRRKIAIVGDMLELGSFAPSAHQAIGRLATQLGIDTILAVGEYAECVARGVREVSQRKVAVYRNVADLMEGLPMMLQEGDGLLVKGSRRMNLEQVTEFLLARENSAHGQLAQ